VDGRVVDQDVDRPELLVNGGESDVDVGAVGDIDRYCAHRDVELTVELVRDARVAWAMFVDDRNGRAQLSETAAGRATDAGAGTASDDDDPPGEFAVSLHDCLGSRTGRGSVVVDVDVRPYDHDRTRSVLRDLLAHRAQQQAPESAAAA